mmetsp:Transcript_62989/g.177673  ORF Transcript_62989/g.177673 Transcript_62989/m.177673 type:complete len:293 (+) Transcript_62989:1-879(+)
MDIARLPGRADHPGGARLVPRPLPRPAGRLRRAAPAAGPAPRAAGGRRRRLHRPGPGRAAARPAPAQQVPGGEARRPLVVRVLHLRRRAGARRACDGCCTNGVGPRNLHVRCLPGGHRRRVRALPHDPLWQGRMPAQRRRAGLRGAGRLRRGRRGRVRRARPGPGAEGPRAAAPAGGPGVPGRLLGGRQGQQLRPAHGPLCGAVPGAARGREGGPAPAAGGRRRGGALPLPRQPVVVQVGTEKCVEPAPQGGAVPTCGAPPRRCAVHPAVVVARGADGQRGALAVDDIPLPH